MILETDFAIIARMSVEKEEENLRFRSFLKICNRPEREIDGTVHRLYSRISSEIDCKQCANCCNKLSPVLNPKDVRDFSYSLGLPINEFKSQYLVKDETEGRFRFNRLPCPFLRDSLCTNYDHRPLDCRSFPHLHKPDFTCRLLSVLENYAICPIVFNVYEYLKNELW